MSFLFCNHLDEEERVGFFTLIVFLMYKFGCKCSVALPHAAVGWFVVCDCVFFLISITNFFDPPGFK